MLHIDYLLNTCGQHIYKMLSNILIKNNINGGMKLFEVTSNVIQQNPNSKSLRTTIPSEIVGILELTDTDKLSWDVNSQNDKIVVTVKKE